MVDRGVGLLCPLIKQHLGRLGAIYTVSDDRPATEGTDADDILSADAAPGPASPPPQQVPAQTKSEGSQPSRGAAEQTNAEREKEAPSPSLSSTAPDVPPSQAVEVKSEMEVEKPAAPDDVAVAAAAPAVKEGAEALPRTDSGQASPTATDGRPSTGTDAPHASAASADSVVEANERASAAEPSAAASPADDKSKMAENPAAVQAGEKPTVSMEISNAAFTTTLKEEEVVVDQSTGSTLATSTYADDLVSHTAEVHPLYHRTQHNQIIIEDGSFISSQFSSSTTEITPTQTREAKGRKRESDAVVIKEETGKQKEPEHKRQRTEMSAPSEGDSEFEESGRHLLVMKYNQEALAQRKAQMGHFQHTFNTGNSVIAPFPHLMSTTHSTATTEVSNLRRYRVLEGLPEPIHNFVCKVQWPDGVTYKKLSASGHTDYVQYNRISFFAGLSSCYEALECIDLSQYKQCRNGSTYVLPIGKCISFDDKSPHWIIMSIVDCDDPTLIIVNASPSTASQPPSGSLTPSVSSTPAGPASSPSVSSSMGLSASPQIGYGSVTSTPSLACEESSLSNSGDDASSFSDNLVAQYLSHFLAYLEPEASEEKSHGGREDDNRTFYSLEDAFDAISSSSLPTKTIRPASPTPSSAGYSSGAYGASGEISNSIFDIPASSTSSVSSGTILSATDLRVPPTDGLPGHLPPLAHTSLGALHVQPAQASNFGIFTPALGSIDDRLLNMQSGNVNPQAGLASSSYLYTSPLTHSPLPSTSAHHVPLAYGSTSAYIPPISHLQSTAPAYTNSTPVETMSERETFKVLRVNLNKQYIPALPPMIGRLQHLQSLNLRRNHLQELPAEFGDLRNLQYLVLSYNRLQRLPDTFGNLTNLRMLDLHSNKLTRLPDSFVNLSNLEYLTISYNQLNTLPRDFGSKFHKLEFLNLENNQLSSALSSEGLLMPMANEDDDGNTHSLTLNTENSFPSLVTLRLGCNQLTTFPPGLCQYATSLHELNLSRNQISFIPPSISNLVNLRLLYLGVNPIEYIPPEICLLENLYVLGIHQTFITELPPELVYLYDLESLYLRKSAFRVLPDVIFQMTMIRKLDLNFIRLTSLPPEIGQLKNLEILQLRETMVKTLPREIINLQKLTDLDLSLNNLTTVPEEVLELSNLRTLEIMYNHLQTLPSDIGNKLVRLRNLDVSHNKLTKLPQSLSKLVELRQLDLSCNKLPHIPEEVLRLPHLKFLSFGYNKLTNEEKKTLKKRFKD